MKTGLDPAESSKEGCGSKNGCLAIEDDEEIS
jgi:hypothetical protein